MPSRRTFLLFAAFALAAVALVRPRGARTRASDPTAGRGRPPLDGRNRPAPARGPARWAVAATSSA